MIMYKYYNFTMIMYNFDNMEKNVRDQNDEIILFLFVMKYLKTEFKEGSTKLNEKYVI